MQQWSISPSAPLSRAGVYAAATTIVDTCLWGARASHSQSPDVEGLAGAHHPTATEGVASTKEDELSGRLAWPLDEYLLSLFSRILHELQQRDRAYGRISNADATSLYD